LSIKRYRGVIVKETPLKESDRLLTILTKEDGLIRAYAKFARKPGQNMLISTSVMTFSEFEISGTESGGYFIKSAHVIEGFTAIKDDVVRLTYCSHIMEIVIDALVDASSAADVFPLLLYTLQHITQPSCVMELTVHTFELKMMYILGLMPLLEFCASCGKPISVEKMDRLCFSFHHCGVCCDETACRFGVETCTILSGATYACMRYIANASLSKLYSFTLSNEYIRELATISTRFLCERMEKCYTKLSLLEEFNV
jgi:DNA repair protein RecO (recombination protein O)